MCARLYVSGAKLFEHLLPAGEKCSVENRVDTLAKGLLVESRARKTAQGHADSLLHRAMLTVGWCCQPKLGPSD